eukprot:352206-Chlamydomonas_euryale.AAC.2
MQQVRNDAHLGPSTHLHTPADRQVRPCPARCPSRSCPEVAPPAARGPRRAPPPAAADVVLMWRGSSAGPPPQAGRCGRPHSACPHLRVSPAGFLWLEEVRHG